MIPTFYDVETKRTIKAAGDHVSKCGISLAVVRYKRKTYDFRDNKKDLETLVAVLAASDLLVSFNGLYFDNKVVRGAAAEIGIDFDPSIAVPNYDVLTEIFSVMKFRVKLDNVSQYTLEQMPDGRDGLYALEVYGRILEARKKGETTVEAELWEELVDYCVGDVDRLERIFDEIAFGRPIRFKHPKTYDLTDVILRRPPLVENVS